MMLWVLALMAAQGSAAAAPPPAATFSSYSARSRVMVEVTIRHAGAAHYTFERIVSVPGESARRAGSDTRKCPAMRDRLIALRTMPAPSAFIAILDDDSITVTWDGTTYQLDTEAVYPNAGMGRMSIQSNVGTPLRSGSNRRWRLSSPAWNRARV